MVGLHILMDGNNTAYRANCTTELYTKSGERTSAIMGVLNITHNVIENLSKDFKNLKSFFNSFFNNFSPLHEIILI